VSILSNDQLFWHNSFYSLDATFISLCLSLFPWAPFRPTKAGIKLLTLARPPDTVFGKGN
jgi:hypothetical protein